MRSPLILFSRSARPSPFGKRTQSARTKLAPSTKAALEQLWRNLGYSNESEFLAEHLEVVVHGPDHVLKVHRRRIEALTLMAQEKDTKAQ